MIMGGCLDCLLLHELIDMAGVVQIGVHGCVINVAIVTRLHLLI